ncbi:MAG: hypothetical protein HY648_12445 [Acidobacteria bacterium]|nr:hypothetical protein [Acidobacteriota bacterium]
MYREARLISLLTLGGIFLAAVVSRAGESIPAADADATPAVARTNVACVTWSGDEEQEVNKIQGERLYFEATRWIEARFGSQSKRLRPCITVYIGKACPDSRIAGACANPVLGAVFVPRWEKTSIALVVQGILTSAILQLVTPMELTEVSKNLYLQDLRDYFDVLAEHKPDGTH